MFDFNQDNNGSVLKKSEIVEWCELIMNGIERGIKQVAVSFDQQGEPFAMIVAHEKSNINGWIHGLTKVRYPTNHYNKSAPIFAPALDLMINVMESKGYYKFWAINHKIHLDIRFKIMSKYSNMLNRYDTYDEMIIPAGQDSGVKMWDIHRRIDLNKDSVVRLYVLRQEHRLPLLQP